MWYALFKCGCATKAKDQAALLKCCPKHTTTNPKTLQIIGRPSNALRRALYKLEKPKRKTHYKIYQAAYHANWVTRNKATWNTYQRKWREKKRGYPISPRFAPGKLKALIKKYGVSPTTIHKWIKKGKLKVKKDYP